MNFSPILTGCNTTVRLIPIKNQLAIKSSGYDVPVYIDRLSIHYWERNCSRFYGSPSSPGDTVFGRVDRVAHPLTRKVGDEKGAVRPSRGVLIDAVEKLSWAECLESLFIQQNIFPTPVSDLHGEALKVWMLGNNFWAISGMQ